MNSTTFAFEEMLENEEEALEAKGPSKEALHRAKVCDVTSALVEELEARFGTNVMGKAHNMSYHQVVRASAHYEVVEWIRQLYKLGEDSNGVLQ